MRQHSHCERVCCACCARRHCAPSPLTRRTRPPPVCLPRNCPACALHSLQTVIVTHVPEGPRNLAKVELEELYIRLCDMHTSMQEAQALCDSRAKTLSQKKTEILDLKSTCVPCRAVVSRSGLLLLVVGGWWCWWSW